MVDCATSGLDQLLNRGVFRLFCFFCRHWLALLLTPALIFVTLPFLAPVAMHYEFTNLGRAIYWLYALFCHQLPQRSWFLFGPKLTYSLQEINQVYPYSDWWRLRQFLGTPEMGWKMAWSDRMVSLYFMTPVFGLCYSLLRRVRMQIQPLSVRSLLWSLLPLFLDGMSRLVSDSLPAAWGGGFRSDNQWLALLTMNALPDIYSGDAAFTFNWWMRLLTGVVANA